MKNPYRLDRTVEPIVYTIGLEPDLNAFTFQGSESITLRARKPFSKITLHCVEIEVKMAFLVLKSSNEKILAKRISYDKKFETVTFDFGRKVRPVELGTLFIEFSGSLNDRMQGFYRTSYQVEGKKQWGAATQFEATDARRAFPCWDEPDAKARFKISLIVPQHLTALSNMPVENQKKISDGRKELHYNISPIMSTYLVCFVVAELEYIEGKDKNGVLIRIYMTPGKKEQGRFALQVAKHALAYFSKWFGIPYALPKCDMVALPDFASGAMENWGLVTYRETALLVDAKNSSASAKQRVAEVIDHELAHQWFGNLVTMRWWTDLWLNEGFASYMGPKAVHDQFPEWKIWEQFIVSDYLHALHDDALLNTHPIEIPVQNPSEIREIFDAITYSKGSSVNRMLEHTLGEKIFQKGLRVYLKKYAYQNATTRDLWRELENVSKKPVRAIMASYTDQPGYPVLKVKKINGVRECIKIDQERFIFDGSPDKAKALWNIPLEMRSVEPRKLWRGFFKTRSTMVDFSGSAQDWIKINPSQSGFYRVAYSQEMMESLIPALQNGSLPNPTMDALGLLSDSLALARAGKIDTMRVLQVADALKNQRDFNIWTLLAGALCSVESQLEDKHLREKFVRFAQSLIAPCASDLGWRSKKDDSHLHIMLRSLVIFQSGHFGDERVIQEAQRRFECLKSGDSLDANLRGAVYSLVAENGTDEDFSSFVKIYKASTLQEEKVRVLRAMTHFRDQAVVAKILNFALSNEVRKQDSYAVLAGFGGNEAARAQSWAFIKSNIKDLQVRYHGGSVSVLGRILEGATTGFKKEHDLKDVRSFFKKHPVAGAERTMKQSLETIQSNIRWQPRAEREVSAYFLT